MKNIPKTTQNLAIPLFFAIVSSDILYLYADGAWYDPNRFIEAFEVAIMFLFVLWGISLFVWRVCHISNHVRGKNETTN